MKLRAAITTVAAVFVIVLAVWSVNEIRYRRELARRRHQIGQLWTLMVLYYCPQHHNQFPDELATLKRLPQYNSFFDRAISEIELSTPGADRTQSDEIVVLRERQAD